MLISARTHLPPCLFSCWGLISTNPKPKVMGRINKKPTRETRGPCTPTTETRGPSTAAQRSRDRALCSQPSWKTMFFFQGFFWEWAWPGRLGALPRRAYLGLGLGCLWGCPHPPPQGASLLHLLCHHGLQANAFLLKTLPPSVPGRPRSDHPSDKPKAKPLCQTDGSSAAVCIQTAAVIYEILPKHKR